MNTVQDPIDPNPKGIVGSVLVAGFGSAAVMWCAAFVTHFPGLDLAPAVAGPVVLGCWAAAAHLLSARAPAAGRLKAGVLSGIVAAAIGILILGAKLVESPAGPEPAPGVSGIRPAAALTVTGFLALGALIGLLGAVTARRSLPSSARPRDHLAEFAFITVATIAPLLLIGGAVTSTNSGMAIRGWPDSYGANMFLYPVSLMVSDPAKFLEHSHRLFGTLVGLTTLTLMIWVLRAERRGRVRGLAVGLFAVVVVQGILGGVRVRLGHVDPAHDNRYWSLVHGVLAQGVFALAVAVAVMLRPLYRDLPRFSAAFAPDAPLWRRMRMFSTALLHSTILQLILGAAYRHLKTAGVKGATHAVFTHAAFSVVVVGFAMVAGFKLQAVAARCGEAATTMRRLGLALVAVVAAQFGIGWIALWAVTADPMTGTPWVQPLIATLHQANGALVLALATASLVWARAVHRSAITGG